MTILVTQNGGASEHVSDKMKNILGILTVAVVTQYSGASEHAYDEMENNLGVVTAVVTQD